MPLEILDVEADVPLQMSRSLWLKGRFSCEIRFWQFPYWLGLQP